MSPADSYELQVLMTESISGLWELWLGGTFAVIIATHLGRESITKPLLCVVCLLYLAASSGILVRWTMYAFAINHNNQQLIAAGYEVFPVPSWYPIAISIITVGTFVVGTVATLVFAVLQFRGQERRTGT